MYRYSNGQISLADFKQPVGMNLKESNRWVKKAQTIPWLETAAARLTEYLDGRCEKIDELETVPQPMDDVWQWQRMISASRI